MFLLTIVHPQNPSDLLEIYGVLFVTLLLLLSIFSLYDWLKTKPWKKQQSSDAPPFIDASPTIPDTHYTTGH
jgi:hypothetical protein